MWTSFEAPHPPYEALEQFVRLYDRVDVPPPVVGDWATGDGVPHPVRLRRWTHNLDTLSPALVEAARRHYYAQITHVDYELGRLFGELQSQQLWRDTVVLFTSDHGEMLGDHGSFHKSLFYEPSARVPFLLRIPAHLEPPARAGSVASRPVLLADIYPTCLTLAGIPAEEGDAAREGASLLAPEPYAGASGPRWVFGLCGAAHGTGFATDGRWKYLYYVWGGTEQLFDLANDPMECHDLARRDHGTVRAVLVDCRERLRRAVPQLARPDGDARRPFIGVDEPLPDEAAARASNPFAWRGPIRYGGHW
jgi:arylsulfatase A-like enzyme